MATKRGASRKHFISITEMIEITLGACAQTFYLVYVSYGVRNFINSIDIFTKSFAIVSRDVLSPVIANVLWYQSNIISAESEYQGIIASSHNFWLKSILLVGYNLIVYGVSFLLKALNKLTPSSATFPNGLIPKSGLLIANTVEFILRKIGHPTYYSSSFKEVVITIDYILLEFIFSFTITLLFILISKLKKTTMRSLIIPLRLITSYALVIAMYPSLNGVTGGPYPSIVAVILTFAASKSLIHGLVFCLILTIAQTLAETVAHHLLQEESKKKSD